MEHVPSHIIARHNWIIVKIIIVIPTNNSSCLYKRKNSISTVIIISAPIAPIIGQGLWEVFGGLRNVLLEENGEYKMVRGSNQ